MKWEGVQFATVQEVVELHDAILEATGGADGILKPNELESAVLSPQAAFGGQPLLTTIADIASAYVFYLVNSRAFVDGNKRTAIAVAESFLDVNGFEINLDSIEWAKTIEGVATGSVSREKLAELFAEQMEDWGELSW